MLDTNIITNTALRDAPGNEQPSFPPELLQATAGARVRYFREKRIGHDSYNRVLARAKLALRYTRDPTLLWIYGATGIGKTVLSKKLLAWLLEEAWTELESDPGMLAALLVEVAAAGGATPGKFDWTDLYVRVLRAANEICIEHKVDLTESGITFSNNGRLIVRKGTEVRRLRHAVEKCLIYRKVNALLLDEAHHFAKVAAGGKALLDQMDALKSLTNITNTSIVLFGTYELLPLLGLSDQLCRRSVSLHFERYMYGVEADVTSFCRAVRSFERSLPLQRMATLIDVESSSYEEDYHYFYVGSCGCVGILKDWLCRALAEAIEDQERQSFRTYLEHQRLPDSDLVAIMSRIRRGEALLMRRQERSAELDRLVLTPVDPAEATPPAIEVGGPARPATMESDELSQEGTESPKGSKRKQKQPRARKKGLPGERNPTRDPIGSKA
jgi:hypothetical protein